MNATPTTDDQDDERDPEILAILEQMRADPGWEVSQDRYESLEWELAHRE
jgi:hypothetical protein